MASFCTVSVGSDRDEGVPANRGQLFIQSLKGDKMLQRQCKNDFQIK